MATADLLYTSGFDLSTSGHSAYERWVVHGLSDINNLTPAQAAGLPKIGDTKTFVATDSYVLQVVGVNAETIISPTARYVGILYRSDFGYAGYKHAVGRGLNGSRTIHLNNWTGTSGSGIWNPLITPIKRGVAYVLKTSFVSLSPSVIELFFQSNTDRSYVINGLPMILHAYRGLESNSSALQIETTFRAEAPVRAYTAGGYNASQSIAIPALSWNDDYFVRPPNPEISGAGGDPTITVKTQAQLYDVGDPFPWTL